MRVVDAHPGDASGAVAPLLRSLHGPECILKSALAVGADALYQLWTQRYTSDTRINLTHLVVAALRAGRDPLRASVGLRSVLRPRFSLAPQQWDPLNAAIEAASRGPSGLAA